METVRDFIFLGSKITADSDCSHEVERRLPLGRKTVTAVQFSAVPQSCLTLCNPVDCGIPGFPVLHQFPECRASWKISNGRHGMFLKAKKLGHRKAGAERIAAVSDDSLFF